MLPARHPRPRRLLAAEIVLVVLAVALILPDDGAIPVALLGMPVLLYGWIGARIAERAPENPIGWLLSTAALVAAAALVGDAYAGFGRHHGGGWLPFTGAVRIATEVVPPPVIVVCFLIVFLSFPSGRLPSPRWRPALWFVLGLGLVFVLAIVGDPGSSVARLIPRVSSAIPFRDLLPDVALTLGAAAFLVTVASLFVHSRRASQEERREIRGLLITLLAMAATVPPFAIFIRTGGNWVVGFTSASVFALGLLVVVPFSLSISMLRYGLFDYEVGVRKTIARGVLMAATVLVAGALLFLVASMFLGTFLARDTGRPMPQVAATALGIGLGVVLMLLVRWARGFADRVVFRERATPYEVLSEFSGRVGETYSLEDVLPRMAMLLAKGTGAVVARVWLDVDGELRPIAAFPEGTSADGHLIRDGAELRTDDPATHAFPVRQQGDLLGALAVTMPANDPMNAQKERLVADVARQAGLVLRNVGLLEEVRESRRRIVATQDARARALERNIHDGAQQQLVALTVKLRLADQLVERDPAAARRMLETLQGDATAALEDLRDLARGIYPPLLADEGLAAALGAQARKSTTPVTLRANGLGRHSEAIESAVYFSCLEALQNVAKYADASHVEIRLTEASGALRFEVSDDGRGFDTRARLRGTGLQGISDRMDALGGTLAVRSGPGEGTVVAGSVPVA